MVTWRMVLLSWLVIAAGTLLPGPGGSPVAAQVPATGERALASSYSTFLIASEVGGGWLDSRETLIGVGRLFLPGAQNRWLVRSDLAAGFVSGWRATDGLVLQAQVGFGRALLTDILQLGGGRTVDIYPVAGGGVTGQWVWASESEEQGRDWSPILSGGLGFRLVGGPDDPGELVAFEAFVEERLRLQSPRIFLRISIHRPRGVTATEAALRAH